MAKEQDSPVSLHLSDNKVPSTLSQFEIQQRITGRGSTLPPKVWFCCRNGRTDPRLLQYITTALFSFIILVFSIVQLIRLPSAEAQNTYISLLTLVFGIFIPTPKIKL